MGTVMTLCQCGCGNAAPIMTGTDRPRGRIKGQYYRFCAGHYRRARATNDYPSCSAQGHPKAKNGKVREHILVAERALGRHLPDGAQVHHVDGDRTSNSRSNLVICQDYAYHSLLHLRARAFKACGNPTYRHCRFCDRWDSPENMIDIGNRSVAHHGCRMTYDALRRARKRVAA